MPNEAAAFNYMDWVGSKNGMGGVKCIPVSINLTHPQSDTLAYISAFWNNFQKVEILSKKLSRLHFFK
jgi:hypothetical protein